MVTILIPVYNEAETLPGVIPDIAEFCRRKQWRLVCVNDGSTDGSKALLNELSQAHGFSVHHHKLNRGYGAAMKTGIRTVETDYTLTMDADGQHSIADCERLYEALVRMDADMMLGSRQGMGSSGGFWRGIGKSLIRRFASLLMPLRVYDINSGMRIYRTAIAQESLHLLPDTFSFSDTLTLVFVNSRHLVCEIPITVGARRGGTSTISLQTAFETVMEILNIAVLFNPMKIFLPVALACFSLGVPWGLYIFSLGHGVSVGSSLLIITGVLSFLLGLIAEQLSSIKKTMYVQRPIK
ncbi:MAG TPA: glycosyltransferase family 2 protein [Bacteroidota bacterium]|nr:glycosyltransferase family 2 protein [Bacteroidota bacterium]